MVKVVTEGGARSVYGAKDVRLNDVSTDDPAIIVARKMPATQPRKVSSVVVKKNAVNPAPANPSVPAKEKRWAKSKPAIPSNPAPSAASPSIPPRKIKIKRPAKPSVPATQTASPTIPSTSAEPSNPTDTHPQPSTSSAALPVKRARARKVKSQKRPKAQDLVLHEGNWLRPAQVEGIREAQRVAKSSPMASSKRVARTSAWHLTTGAKSKGPELDELIPPGPDQMTHLRAASDILLRLVSRTQTPPDLPPLEPATMDSASLSSED